ncbi:MAG: hypothetical protein K2G23_07185 [Muribaculaceae bacterium]|nr:hypothetical protein [Muribaculaceae bacterium]
MDSIIQENIDELVSEFKKRGADLTDPVSKLMVTALLHQAQKIKDEISSLPGKIVSRLCEYFIPKSKIDAIPALCLLQPALKAKKGMEAHSIAEGTFFSFKVDNKTSLTYFPLFRNYILPVTANHILTDKKLIAKGSRIALDLKCKGKVWVGLEMPGELETLENVSFLIRGTNGVFPEKILVGNEMTDISYTPANNLSDIPMMDPFDSQQANASSIEVFSNWQRQLAEMADGRLIYITDPLKDRDIFKYRAYPKSFQQYLESNDLDKFENNTLWILFDFGEEYEVPENIEIIPNVVPAVNVSLNSLTLTQSSPIAKLTKGDGSYFLNLVETSLPAQKQGFNAINEDVVVRDFDVNCYNKNMLHRDVRNLYNRFIEDYYAFVDYHSLKDGELIRTLRELVNKIGKGVVAANDVKNRFDEGTYAMRSVALIGKPVSVKVSYLTTHGKLGNSPKEGMKLENKKDVALEKDVKVISSATGGEDKATADQRYEMLRYYSLTCDRLYTKMDIDAFLRIQLLKEFGKEEVKRISYDISVQGAGGPTKLVRGLYIDIKFKDEKNYRKAMSSVLDRKLHQMIMDKSCISMPIIVTLMNAESK